MREVQRQSVVAIVGPTGIGKTALSLELASRSNIEVVNCDSRQVYRGMDIGTAKPKPEEQLLAPHHLLDIADPDEEFSLARYLGLAREAIDGVHRRGRIPVLVGGTGQYVWAVLEGWQAPRVPPNPELRARLYERAASEEGDELYLELVQKDPEAAKLIDPRNIRRVIRALEVIAGTGQPFSAQRVKRLPGWRTTVIGLTMERKALYARLDARADQMAADGWPDEVRWLLERGYSPELPSFSSLGYREMAEYVQGRATLADVMKSIKIAMHKLARHQYTWFRLADPRIRWIDLSTTPWDTAVKEAVGAASLA